MVFFSFFLTSLSVVLAFALMRVSKVNGNWILRGINYKILIYNDPIVSDGVMTGEITAQFAA